MTFPRLQRAPLVFRYYRGARRTSLPRRKAFRWAFRLLCWDKPRLLALRAWL